MLVYHIKATLLNNELSLVLLALPHPLILYVLHLGKIYWCMSEEVLLKGRYCYMNATC